MAGQNIKTNYTQTGTKEPAHHAERRALNRRLRDTETSEPESKMGNRKYRKETIGHVGGHPISREEHLDIIKRGGRQVFDEDKAAKKKGGEYEGPVSPKKSKTPEPTTKQKVVGFLKDRAEAIAHETRDIRPRGKGPGVYGAMSMGLPANPDLFGVGGFGGLHQMMGADPFHDLAPSRPPAFRTVPQRKKKKGKRRASSSGGPPGMFGGIPDSMRWMF